MKPKIIIMSAFGPYANEAKVEMDKLGDKGIYLITGDTGAGKTTIFDAITFALFGEASGDNRENTTLRSKYANPETKTFVELHFEYRNNIYIIKRNPEYLRPAKRGSGNTKEAANAELVMPNGDIITGIKNVNEKIEDIVGLNKSQFMQIAMIAQGEFLKLLLATTDERLKVFRKIFDTSVYKNIQEKLKEDLNIISKKYQETERSMEQYKKSIVSEEDFSSYNSIEIISKLDELINRDEQLEKQSKIDGDDFEKELEELNNQIGKETLRQKTMEERNRAKIELEELEPKFQESLNLIKKINELKEQKEKLAIEIDKDKGLLNLYNEREVLENSLKQLNLEIKNINSNQENNRVTFERLNLEIKNGNAVIEEYKDINLDTLKLRLEYEKVCEKITSVKEAIAEFLKIEVCKDVLEQSQKKLIDKISEKDTIVLQCQKIENEFLLEQAGIIASKLEENYPCPVCGSMEHPALAKISEFAPSENDVKDWRKNVENIKGEVQNQSLIVNENQVRLEGQIEKFEKIVNNNGKNKIETYNEQLLIGIEKELLQKKQSIKNEIDIVESLSKKKNETEKIIIKSKEMLENLTIKINENKVLVGKLEESIKNETEKIIKLNLQLTFGTKHQLLTSITTKEEHKNNIERQCVKIEGEYNARLKRKAELNSKLETLNNQLENVTELDLVSLNTKKIEIEEKRNYCLTTQRNVFSRKKNNIEVKRSMEEKIKQRASLNDEFEMIASLSQTANGDLKGKEKILFETYVQMQYFQKVLHNANLRFESMTNGQYEMIRSKAAKNFRSQTGLEIDVIDHFNGSIRSVNSLSGGEAFKASLSLALGLSDVIESSSGGIKLDVMFIDEGFGSLDTESLSQAINILNGLWNGNKLVGIISHVPELKERINRQIVVSKDRANGSSIELII
ncbi:MAG: SMC family ATPase [Anaerovoracaceae bacterium]